MNGAGGHGDLSGVASRVILRLVIAAMVALPLAVLHGERMVHAMLPMFGAVFEWVSNDFKLLRLAIDHEGADRVLRATVMWKHIVFIGGHVIYPDPRGTANVSTLMAHALQGPLTALLVTCAWPSDGNASHEAWREVAARLLVLGPLLPVLICIDLPVVLAGELWQLALDALDPNASSMLVYWKSFMQGGGRYALGFGAAILAVHWGRSLSMRR
jgi:hypothetical protein